MSVSLRELTSQESGMIMYGNEVIICNWSSFDGLPKMFASGIIDWPTEIPVVEGEHYKDLSVLLDDVNVIYNVNNDELPISGTVYRISNDVIVIAPDGWV